MKAAVVGGGFAGLALCWHLLSLGCRVDLYEKEEVGSGSSGLASGLLHPYVGEDAKRSLKATEGLKATLELLRLAEQYSDVPVGEYKGIERKTSSEETAKRLRQHSVDYQDVEEVEPGLFWIRSGITVHSLAYIKGLYRACLDKGLQFVQKEVSSFEEIQGYDKVFFAVGAGIFSFVQEKLLQRLGCIKGQVVECLWPSELPELALPLMDKGHIVPMERGMVSIGGTYERGVKDPAPCMERALAELTPRMQALVPKWKKIEAIGVKAGFRVTSVGHYFPTLQQVRENVWVLTGLGSRGLLYHAYAAKILVEMALGESRS